MSGSSLGRAETLLPRGRNRRMITTPVFISIGAVAIIIAGTLLASLGIAKITRLRISSERSDQSDFVNMMLLFQTMRDVLNEQKELARQFNQSLDKKVTLVRELVESAQAERDELRKTHQELLRLISDFQGDANAPGDRPKSPRLDHDALDAEHLPNGQPASEVTGTVLDVSSAAGDDETPPEPATQETPALDILPSEQYVDGDDLIDSWTGIDFGGDEPSDENFPVPHNLPEQSEDPVAARDAFRALLDMDPEPRPVSGTVGGILTDTSQTSGNGAKAASPSPPRRDQTPVQRRVYEYRDAGMRVSDIARELGVGKGEVRLILSLRSDR